ncbi:hypothetical protein [Burkholderia metallica]|uniref:hypothetical protein n=1 Tax=Burkholderia metallica TaxID=488729 RepID=UPI00157B1EA0|nr:hypothetical protein [Burkholderia metallica]
MNVLYVRVQPKKGIERFFRCGIAFVREWQEVEVDDATAKRLSQEQMLEVSDTRPEDMPPQEGGATQESSEEPKESDTQEANASTAGGKSSRKGSK